MVMFLLKETVTLVSPRSSVGEIETVEGALARDEDEVALLWAGGGRRESDRRDMARR